MRRATGVAGAIATIALGVSCSGGVGYIKTRNAPSNLKINGGDQGPSITWDRCEEFGLKKCGDKLKVTSISVVPLSCTVGGEQTGKRPAQWSIAVDAMTPGANFKPPVEYGVVPEGAVVETPAHELTKGCRYMIFIGVMSTDEAHGETIQETFDW